MGHYNEALIAAYEELGARVDLVTSSHDPEHETHAEVHVSRFFRIALERSKPRIVRAAGYVGGYLGCLRMARRADIVVMHFLHLPTVDRWALTVMRRLGPRLVLVAHEPKPFQERQRGQAFQKSLHAFDLIVVHGPHARDEILARGVPQDRVVVASHGEFRPMASLSPAGAPEILGVRSLTHPVAAIIGNLRPGKGIRRAREALEVPGSPVGTLLVAGARQGNWEIEEALSVAQDSPLQVVRLDRRMSDAEERAAYSAADVVLALYDSGYSSGVISRAHSMGKPVVLTDVGDLAQQVGPCDVVVPPDYNAKQLRDAVGQCLQADHFAPAEWNTEAWRLHAAVVLARLASR